MAGASEELVMNTVSDWLLAPHAVKERKEHMWLCRRGTMCLGEYISPILRQVRDFYLHHT